MAGTMVHLLVAEKLYQGICSSRLIYAAPYLPVPDEAYFIAGNICPDGIMAREKYQREMKLHTHFRDGIPDGSFEAPGMVELFEERMKVFWQQHLQDEKEKPGLYLGYITHMMTDERFILDERPKFFGRIAKLGLTERDRETFVRFGEETDLVDFRLIHDFPEITRAKELLEGINPYEIRGMLEEKELTASREWILQYFFGTEHPLEETEYLLYNSMTVFAEQVTEEILERLQKENYLKREKGLSC